MTWRAPAVGHLFDQRLQQARLELMEDNRIRLALRRQGREGDSFLRHLIEEKLAAAARSGMGAVETSLRSDATNFLVKHGHDAKEVRNALGNLGVNLLDVESAIPHKLKRELARPGAMALLFFVAWTVTITLGWLFGDTHDGLYALFITGGALVTVLVYLMVHANNLRYRAEIAHEYPVHLCRAYEQALKKGIARYEDAVERIAHNKRTHEEE